MEEQGVKHPRVLLICASQTSPGSKGVDCWLFCEIWSWWCLSVRFGAGIFFSVRVTKGLRCGCTSTCFTRDRKQQLSPSSAAHLPNSMFLPQIKLLNGKIPITKYERVKPECCWSQFLALATLIQNSKRLGHSAILGKKKREKKKENTSKNPKTNN